jgi:putative redox protein
MPTQRVTFENHSGIELAGIIDRPESEPQLVAVMAHCFSCTKDLKAMVKVSRSLAAAGVAVLRFDFTGLGGSQGDFSDSNFQTNIQDLDAAVNWMVQREGRVDLLVGHSLGGAAAMALAMHLDTVKGIVTLASPSDTMHLADVLDGLNPKIETDGVGDVVIGGITHRVKKQMLDTLRSFDLETSILGLQKPHLILHSPADKTVDYRHALQLLAWTAGAKSLVTLNGADHLLINSSSDTDDVAMLMFLWAKQWCQAS